MSISKTLAARQSALGLTLALAERALGAGSGFRRINPSTYTGTAVYDCRSNDPAGDNEPARAIVVCTSGTIDVVDASGNLTQLPAPVGWWIWQGTRVYEIRGGTCTDAVLIW